MINERKVRESFKQVKKDNEFLVKWISYLKERIEELSLIATQNEAAQNEHEEWKKNVEKKFNEHLMKQSEEKEIVHQQFTEAQNRIIRQYDGASLDILTEQQRKTLFLIGSLQREHGAQYVPVRTTNAELYGTQNVEKMQTTVANYLKRLEELHFIERMKKGRHSYVRLSEYGMKMLASHHVEQMKSPVMLH